MVTDAARMEPLFDTAGDTGEITSSEIYQPTVNELCPLDLRRVDPAAPRREINGEFVGFCCRDCAGAWDALDAADKRDGLEAVDEINE